MKILVPTQFYSQCLSDCSKWDSKSSLHAKSFPIWFLLLVYRSLKITWWRGGSHPYFSILVGNPRSPIKSRSWKIVHLISPKDGSRTIILLQTSLQRWKCTMTSSLSTRIGPPQGSFGELLDLMTRTILSSRGLRAYPESFSSQGSPPLKNNKRLWRTIFKMGIF